MPSPSPERVQLLRKRLAGLAGYVTDVRGSAARPRAHTTQRGESAARAVEAVTTVAAPRKVPRRFRTSTERGRLAGARLQEAEEAIKFEIMRWRPELMSLWHRVRVAMYRRSKRSIIPGTRNRRLSPFEAFQEYVEESGENETNALREELAANYERGFAAEEAEAYKRAARDRGEEAPSENYRPGGRGWTAEQWAAAARRAEELIGPGSYTAPASYAA